MSIECDYCGLLWTGTGDEAIKAGWVQAHHLPGMPWECPSCDDNAQADRPTDEPYNSTDAYNARQEHLANLGDHDRDERKDRDIQEAHEKAKDAPGSIQETVDEP